MPKLSFFSSSKQKKPSSKEKDGSLATTATTVSKTTSKHESSSDPISAQLEQLHQQSPWLRKRPLTTVPILERDEAHTSSSDKGLSIGSFYSTYTVNRICLKERHENEPFMVMDDSSHSEDNNTNNNSQQAARQHLADSTLEQEGQYCIKYMPKKLYKKLHTQNKSRFLQAVTNLLVEANYLSKFNHPHILPARGQCPPLATADPDSYKHHDAFFLITDRIHETLEDRLETWRTEQAKDPTKYAVDPKCPFFVQALGYCTEIASALTYLHERKIIMLGLTPSGIGFLAQSGRLQLCDLTTCREVAAFDTSATNKFSSAIPEELCPEGGGAEDDDLRFDDDEIGDGERFSSDPMAASAGLHQSHHQGENDDGTTMIMVPLVETGTVPRYMAPELVTQGAAGASLQNDSYSLAIITLETLTLQKAFSHYRSGQFLVKVCMEGKRPNLTMYPQLPSPVEGILKRAWRHSAEKRWSCAQIYEGYQVMMDKLGAPVGNDATTDDVAASTKTPSLMDESIMQQFQNTPRRAGSMSPPRLQQQQQRQSKRGLAHSKATSMRNVTTTVSRDTGPLFRQIELRRNNSASNLLAGDNAAVPLQQEKITAMAATRHSDGGAQVMAETRAAMEAEMQELEQSQKEHSSAVEAQQPICQQQGRCALQSEESGEAQPRKRDSLIDDSEISATRTKDEMQELEQFQKEHAAAVEPQQPISGRQGQGALQPGESGETQRRKGDSLIDESEASATKTKDEAIVMGDGTTVTVKKRSKKVAKNCTSKESKEKRTKALVEKEEDLASFKPPEMRRAQSGPIPPSTSSADRKTKKSTRKMSVNEAEQSGDQSTHSQPCQSSGDAMKKKKIPHRTKSGPTAEKTHDNEAPATDVGKKRLSRRKHSSSTGSLRKKQPMKAVSERHLFTKPKLTRSLSGDHEVAEPENKARHGRRSIDIEEEPGLDMPPMRRHVSAFE